MVSSALRVVIDECEVLMEGETWCIWRSDIVVSKSYLDCKGSEVFMQENEMLQIL
jgi:hypothetical protein